MYLKFLPRQNLPDVIIAMEAWCSRHTVNSLLDSLKLGGTKKEEISRQPKSEQQNLVTSAIILDGSVYFAFIMFLRHFTGAQRVE